MGVRSVSGMSVLRVVESAEARSSDPVVARLDDLLGELAAFVTDHRPVADADRIDQLDRLERIRAVVAAVQTAEMVRFAQSQTAQQLAADVHPKRIGRGIADQIALACRISPCEGSRRLGVARALWFGLPETYAQLTRGALHERVAECVVTETRHLDPTQRHAVDAQVNRAGIDRMGVRAAAQCARKHAYGADPAGYVRAGPDRAQAPPCDHPFGARHHGAPDRLPAGGAGRGLLGRARKGGRRAQGERRPPQPEPDHGRPDGRAADRPGAG